MAGLFAEQIGQAMAAVREQQLRMAEAQRELQQSTASATSRDRMVTAKVGPQGQVVALTFHTTAYQEMAPAELAAALTEVLNTARARMADQVIAAMREFDGFPAEIRERLGGATDLDALMEPLRAVRPGYQEEQERRKRSTRQEEFHG